MTDAPERWNSIIWSIADAKSYADQLLTEVYRRLSLGSDNFVAREVTAETYLTDVLWSLTQDLFVTITGIRSDQWFGISGERWNRETDEDEEFWVQCDRPEYGLAHIWKHYADPVGLAVEDADPRSQ